MNNKYYRDINGLVKICVRFGHPSHIPGKVIRKYDSVLKVENLQKLANHLMMIYGKKYGYTEIYSIEVLHDDGYTWSGIWQPAESFEL